MMLKISLKGIVIMTLSLFVLLGSLTFLSLPTSDDHKAVRVIIGEAADQSFAGKVAVGEVIRRRGGIKGFSSTKKDLAKFSRQQPAKTRIEARIAWNLSKFTNFTRGADHFDNIQAFGVPEWAKKMKKTVKIDDMQYYKSN